MRVLRCLAAALLASAALAIGPPSPGVVVVPNPSAAPGSTSVVTIEVPANAVGYTQFALGADLGSPGGAPFITISVSSSFPATSVAIFQDEFSPSAVTGTRVGAADRGTSFTLTSADGILGGIGRLYYVSCSAVTLGATDFGLPVSGTPVGTCNIGIQIAAAMPPTSPIADLGKLAVSGSLTTTITVPANGIGYAKVIMPYDVAPGEGGVDFVTIATTSTYSPFRVAAFNSAGARQASWTQASATYDCCVEAGSFYIGCMASNILPSSQAFGYPVSATSAAGSCVVTISIGGVSLPTDFDVQDLGTIAPGASASATTTIAGDSGSGVFYHVGYVGFTIAEPLNGGLANLSIATTSSYGSAPNVALYDVNGYRVTGPNIGTNAVLTPASNLPNGTYYVACSPLPLRSVSFGYDQDYYYGTPNEGTCTVTVTAGPLDVSPPLQIVADPVDVTSGGPKPLPNGGTAEFTATNGAAINYTAGGLVFSPGANNEPLTLALAGSDPSILTNNVIVFDVTVNTPCVLTFKVAVDGGAPITTGAFSFPPARQTITVNLGTLLSSSVETPANRRRLSGALGGVIIESDNSQAQIGITSVEYQALSSVTTTPSPTPSPTPAPTPAGSGCKRDCRDSARSTQKTAIATCRSTYPGRSNANARNACIFAARGAFYAAQAGCVLLPSC